MKKYFYKLIVAGLFLIAATGSYSQDIIVKDSMITSISYLFERTDFEIQLSATYTNPYDAEEIALDMIIQAPSGKSLVLPCFYDSVNSSFSVWNARFAPREAGVYSYYFKLSKSSDSVYSTSEKKFNVAPTAENGFIHKKNNWAFIYDSGKPFRGIGEDIGWEAREYENQSYRYDYFLPKLAKNGGNFFRTWMCSWNLPVEWGKVIETSFYSNSSDYFNPGGIARMDQLVRMCDSLDMHMMLTLSTFSALGTSNEWPFSSYNTTMGGPASSPTEFFTLAASKTKYKNFLRYLVARWGYSPSIGAWEFFNEIDNAAYSNSTLVISESAITQWHTEMSSYLKSTDIYQHLITTSVSWRDIAGLNSVSNIDFNQKHIYNYTSTIPSTIQQYESSYSKPYVVGEFGYDWDWNNVTSANGDNFDFDLKRGLWYGLFTSTPILPMTWWWEFFDSRGMTSYFKGVSDISNQMLLAGNGSFSSATVSSGSFEGYAVKCGQKYFVYFLNNSTASATSSVSLNVSNNAEYRITSLDPSSYVFTELNNITATSGSLNMGYLTLPAQTEIVYVISLASDETGIEQPYSAAISIPGKVEAENFDLGGEGLAYHDYDNTNTFGLFRSTEGVDVDTTNDGSYCISDIAKGEWLNYTVNVDISGSYSVNVRIAAADTGKSFRFLLDGQYITEKVKVPNTGGLQNWQLLSVPLTDSVFLTGQKILEIEMNASSDFAIDYIDFTLVNKAPLVNISSPENNSSYTSPANINITANASDYDGSVTKVEFYNATTKIGESLTSPYTISWSAGVGDFKLVAIATDDKGLTSISDTIKGSVSLSHEMPGTIQAEDYDTGGAGVGYYDLTSGNKFGFYRNDDVDIEECTDTTGGYSIGDFQVGEWLQYTMNVTQTGTYRIDFRVATQYDETGFSASIDGQTIASQVSVPNTGGWQEWATISISGVSLVQGERILKLTSLAEYVNINYIIFSLTTGINDVTQDNISWYPNPVKNTLWINHTSNQSAKVYVVNMLGQVIKTCTLSDDGIDMSSLCPGVYGVSIQTDDGKLLAHFKIIKE